MTLLAQVQKYVGSTIVDTDGYVSTLLTQGARHLIDLLPESKLLQIAMTSDFTNSISIYDKRLIDVHSSDSRMARKIDMGEVYRSQDTGSIYYVNPASTTVKDIVYWIEGGNLFILPAGGSAQYVTYPTVVASNTFIHGFPFDMEHIAVLYASVHATMNLFNTKYATVASITPPAAMTKVTVLSPALISTSTEYGYVNTSLGTDEDIELANGWLNKIQNIISENNLAIQKYQTDVSQNSQFAQTDIAIYSAKIQSALSELQQLLQQYQMIKAEYREQLQLKLGIQEANNG